MGLQIRLTNPLGARVIDLPARGIDRPLIVGRSASADVKVSSATVAPEQLALYVHDGYWYAHDSAGDGGVFVNGQPLGEPAALQVGDVIAIGPGGQSATVEVEPTAAAAGHTGYATDQSPPPRPVARQTAGYAAPAYGAPTGYAAPAYAAPPQVPGAGGAPGYDPAAYAQPPQQQDELEQFGATAAPATYSRGRGRRKKQDNTVPIVIGIVVLVVLILGAAGIIVAVKSKKEEPPPPPKAAPKAPYKPKGLFDENAPDESGKRSNQQPTPKPKPEASDE